MSRQTSFADLDYSHKRRRMRREVFLSEIRGNTVASFAGTHWVALSQGWTAGSSADEADINVLPKLLRAEDEVVFGDAGYISDEYKRGSRQLGIRWCVQDKRKPGQNLLGEPEEA